MKASKNPNDVERYDTLCDVNMSFMAAVDILNDLLCYEKLDSGILKLHKENITVVPFLNDNVSMFAAQAREGGVEITVVTDFDITKSISLQLHDSVFVDKFKMDQVIRNLISNALKFTPRGGTINISAKFVSNRRSIDDVTGSSISGLKSILTKKISWCCCRGSRIATTHSPSRINIDVNKGPIDGYLVVIVKDSGAGISAENQKRLFKDIVQFNPEKLQAGGGSGLGLWITKGIVDLHGGKISVNSLGEGMGSSFTVEIPMIRPVHPSMFESQKNCNPVVETDSLRMSLPVSPTRSVQGGFGSPAKSHTPPPLWDVVLTTIGSSTSNTRLPIFDVLVVDDSRLNRKMLLKCLKKDGHVCTEAEDGLEAIERVKERIDFANGGHGKPYDAILMDFVMPNMDGPTATKQLRTMGYTGAIFGVTGNGKSDDEYVIYRQLSPNKPSMI